MVEAFLSGLPALILARMNALSAVPVFTFTNKAPQLITGLVRRTYHAFYPRLMRLHVTGERNGFRNLHLAVGKLVIGIGLAAAGTILALNACIVELLAGNEFFAGKATTVWLAVIVLLVPVCALFESLLQFSGSMGKAPLVAIGKLIVGTVLSVAGYSAYGMPGLAAALATTPLFNAVYGYFRGAQKCGFSPGSLSSSLVLESALAVLLILAAGFFPTPPPVAHAFVELAGRQIPLPSGSEILPGLFVTIAGIFRAAFAFVAFRRSQLRTS
jgi:O-antigen/teichoic acid export membrane protein